MENEKLKELKLRISRDEIEFYKFIFPKMLLLQREKDYGILISDVNIISGYISDIGIRRLQQQFQSTIEHKNGQVILSNAKILGITPNLFLKRKDIIKEFKDMESEGDIYLIGPHLYMLLFPIDLINFTHISVKKWRLQNEKANTCWNHRYNSKCGKK